MIDKSALRRILLDKRARLATGWKKDYDRRMCETLARWIEKQGFRKVHTYLPMGQEIDILPLLQQLLDRGVALAAPKTLGKRKLEHRHLRSLDQLEKGVFGTFHPRDPNRWHGSFDLILVPGLAYDELNYRLGYGGGYYDAFLAEHPKALSLAPAYPFQLMPPLPREAHDLPVDLVVQLREGEAVFQERSGQTASRSMPGQ